MNKNIYLNNEGLDQVMEGFNLVANAVKLTLGPAGANAILHEDAYPGYSITNDGKSIGEKIKSDDPLIQMGINIANEVLQKSDKDGGATSTSLVLAQAILEEGLKTKANPMDIKRSLDECLDVINDNINAQKKDITADDIGKVATVSAEDEKLGAMFQEIYQKVGSDGIIELSTSGLPETFYELTEGVRLRNAGFQYPYMTNDYDATGKPRGKYATYKNPKVLITKQKIATITELDNLFTTLSKDGVGELVIFADDIDPSFSQALAQTHQMGVFKTLVIKAPTLWKDWIYEDFAQITGATIIDPSAGRTFKNMDMAYLGTCEQITASKDETVVRGIQNIKRHIKDLTALGTDEAKMRLSWLQTKTAVLKLGAGSESELSYVRLKAEDARNESYLALQDGVVAGGGLALFNASVVLPKTIGGSILSVALQSPLNQIISNSGGGAIDLGGDNGYNANTGEVVNMFDAGILDSAKVIKNAVKNAISIAGTVLTVKIAGGGKTKTMV